MKKTIQLMLLSLIVSIAPFIGCQKENLAIQDRSNNIEEKLSNSSLSIDEAKSKFDNTHTSNSLVDLDCKTLPNLQISPEWNKAKQYKFNDFSVVETPLLWNGQLLGKVKRKQSQAASLNKNKNDIETVTNLVTTKDIHETG